MGGAGLTWANGLALLKEGTASPYVRGSDRTLDEVVKRGVCLPMWQLAAGVWVRTS